jgi:hypothetical protein
MYSLAPESGDGWSGIVCLVSMGGVKSAMACLLGTVSMYPDSLVLDSTFCDMFCRVHVQVDIPQLRCRIICE